MRNKLNIYFIPIILLIFFSNAQAETKQKQKLQKIMRTGIYKRVAVLENKVEDLNATIVQMQNQLVLYSAALEDAAGKVSANEAYIEQNKLDMVEVWNGHALGDIALIKSDMDRMQLESRFNKLQYEINVSDDVEDLCVQTISSGETINGSWTNECYSTEWYTAKAKYYTFELNEARIVNIELSNEQEKSFGVNLSEGSLRYGHKISSVSSENGFCSINMNLEPGPYTIEVYTSVDYNLKQFTLMLQ